MTAAHIIATERDETLERLEAVLGSLEDVDADQIRENAARAGSSSIGMPPRPRPEDDIGSAHYYANMMLVMAERIAALEQQLAGRSRTKATK